jgi:hypothetical protein
MANKFKTKVSVDNTKVEQTTGTTLNLSGSTIFHDIVVYATDLSLSYTSRTLVDQGYVNNTFVNQSRSARSVIGNPTNATANAIDIVGTADQVLRVNSAGNALAFGAINLAASDAVGTSILPIANGGTGSASQNYWGLGGTYSLTGANNIIGTTSNTLRFNFNGLGVTHTDGAGLWLQNSDAATGVLNQNAPSIVFDGNAWKSDAVAESRNVKGRIQMTVGSGAANPLGNFVFSFSINGGAYSNAMTLQNNGSLSALSAVISGSYTSNSSGFSSNGVNYSVGGNHTGYTSGGSVNVTGPGTSNIFDYNTGKNLAFTAGAVVNYTAFASRSTVSATGINSYVGFLHSPTLTGIPTSHLAFRSDSGSILFANSSSDTPTTNTRLDVRGTGTGSNLIYRYGDSANNLRMSLADNGVLDYASTFTATANNQFSRRYVSTLTSRATASDAINASYINSSITASAASINATGLTIESLFNIIGGIGSFSTVLISGSFTGLTNGTYVGVTPTTSGSGTGATYTATVTGPTLVSFAQTAAGSGYRPGDAISFSASSFGGGTGTLTQYIATVTGSNSFSINSSVLRLFNSQPRYAGQIRRYLDFAAQDTYGGTVGTIFSISSSATASGDNLNFSDFTGANIMSFNNSGTLIQLARNVSISNAATFTVGTSTSTFGGTITATTVVSNGNTPYRSTGSVLMNTTGTIANYSATSSTITTSISTLGTITPGSGYTGGPYNNIALTGGTGTGAIASTINITAGGVSLVVLGSGGTGYTVGDVLSAVIPGGSGFSIPVATLTNLSGDNADFFANKTINDSNSAMRHVGFYSRPTYNQTASATGSLYGFWYNPVRTAVLGTEYAIRTDGGITFIANASGDTPTANTRVDIRGISGGSVFRLADNVNTQLFNVTNTGIISHNVATVDANPFTITHSNSTNNSRSITLTNNNTTTNSVSGIAFNQATIGSTITGQVFLQNIGSSVGRMGIFSTASLGYQFWASSTTGSIQFILGTLGSDNAYVISSGRNHAFTQGINTSGSPVGFSFAGGAHTTLASSEAIDVHFNLNRTVNFSNGAVSTQRAFVIQAPVYSHVSGSNTITTAATLAITNAPTTTGGFTTITNPLALWVQAGAVRFDNNLYGLAGTTSMTDGFTYIPAASGVPSGVPTSYSGRVPLYYDTANNRLYVYNGSWRSVLLS